ncbi:MAG: trigger factor [Bacilli bacterium]
MSVKLEKVSGCKVKLNFVLAEEDFDKAIDEAFEKNIVNVEVKGFRKGKVPRDIYNKKFGEESLFDDALNIAVNKAYNDALLKHKLEIVNSPELDVEYETIGRGKKLKFSVSVEVWPEVELGQYKELEVEKETTEVTEEDIKNYIDTNLKSYAELQIVEDGVLENGYTAVFDFEGFVDGVAFEGGKAENYSLEIGSGQFIPGFEDQMLGLEAGEEKTVKVKFPENYQAENLQGKDAEFKVKLHEMKKRVLPTLNDEFVKELELENINNVEEYNAYVKDLLLNEKKEASENKFVDDLLNKAVENATLEVPQGLVNEEVNRAFSQLENQAKMYNIPVEQFLGFYGISSAEEYKKNVEPSAINNVKQRVVFLKVAEAEKIKISAKEYNEEFDVIAKETNKSVEEVKNLYSKELLAPYLKIRKAIDLIKETAVIK